MPFKKGHKTPGAGRPKGSGNKRNIVRQEIFERIVEKYGDPLEALADMAFGKEYDIIIRKDCMKELVQYGHAKKKAIEITGLDGGHIEMRFELIEQITQLIENLNNK